MVCAGVQARESRLRPAAGRHGLRFGCVGSAVAACLLAAVPAPAARASLAVAPVSTASAPAQASLSSFSRVPASLRAVAGLPPVATVLPAVSGTAREGQTLSSTKGTWTNSPTSYAYQWRRCNPSGASCTDIAGATASTYTLVYADAASTVRVAVTATNTYGSATATSNATKTVTGLPPANTALPTISGTAQQTRTLTASTGTWTNSPTSYAYQWRRCNPAGASCTTITGATANTYTLVYTDAGTTTRVAVTATNTYGSTTATSDQTGVVVGPPPGAFGKTSPADGASGQPTAPTLSWAASDGATAYAYCIDATDNDACDGSWVSTDAAQSAGLSGLTIGTTYYWQVRASNPHGTTDADAGSWFSLRVIGPDAGSWLATLSGPHGDSFVTLTSVRFSVLSDQATVSRFTFAFTYSNGWSCNGSTYAWIDQTSPIVGGQFASPSSSSRWESPFNSGAGGSGTFHGTFDSPTSAHGTAQFFYGIACGPYPPSLWLPTSSWTATWQSP